MVMNWLHCCYGYHYTGEVWLCCCERQIGKLCIVSADLYGFDKSSPQLDVCVCVCVCVCVFLLMFC